MKICLISGSYPETKCGVGDYTACLAEALSMESNDVHIITGVNQSIKRKGNVTIHPLLENWSLVHWYRLIRKIKILKPHVVHLQYPSVGYDKGILPNFLFLLLKLLNPSIKRVLTLHEYECFGWKGKLRLWPALVSAHEIICTNERETNQIRKHHTSKGKCIYLGSNIGQLRKIESNKQTQNKLVYFGTLMPNKGWENLLEALGILNENKTPVYLTAICSLEPEKYEYHKKIAEQISYRQLEKNITFSGYLTQEELHLLLSEYNIAVQPFTEGVRLNRGSLIAMLSYGKAVLTTEPVVEVELVEHGKNCWMVPRENPVELAESIIDLLHKKKLVRSLQEQALQLSEKFSWFKIARSTIKIYNML